MACIAALSWSGEAASGEGGTACMALGEEGASPQQRTTRARVPLGAWACVMQPPGRSGRLNTSWMQVLPRAVTNHQPPTSWGATLKSWAGSRWI